MKNKTLNINKYHIEWLSLIRTPICYRVNDFDNVVAYYSDQKSPPYLKPMAFGYLMAGFQFQ